MWSAHSKVEMRAGARVVKTACCLAGHLAGSLAESMVVQMDD